MTQRWEQSDINRVLNKPPRSKYGAKKIQIDGIWFDSKREGAKYVEYRTMYTAGLINQLGCHPVFAIGIKGIFICEVVLDFKYWDIKQKEWVFVDVKGKDNALSQLKRKLVEAEYGITVELMK